MSKFILSLLLDEAFLSQNLNRIFEIVRKMSKPSSELNLRPSVKQANTYSEKSKRCYY